MITINVGVFLVCVVSCVLGGYSHFYYSVPQAPQPYISYHQGPQFQYTQPAPFPAFRSFAPAAFYTHQTFSAAPAHVTHYQTYSAQQQQHQQQEQEPENDGVTIEAKPKAEQIEPRTLIQAGPQEEYRGFAYHTQYDDGASSNVLFVTGPEARQIQNLGFSDFRVLNKSEEKTNPSNKARNFASNSVDSNAGDNDQTSQTLYTANPTIDLLRSFLENPQIGIQNLYALNGQLFARNIEDSHYPASTIPLDDPVPLENFADSISPRSSIESEESSTSNSTESATEKAEEEGAESVVADTRLRFNDLLQELNDKFTEESHTVVSTSSEAQSTESSTTTEAVTTTKSISTSTMGAIVVEEISSESNSTETTLSESEKTTNAVVETTTSK